VKALLPTLLALGLLAAPARAQLAPKPIVYNEAAGDGSIELDREIKEAYAAMFTITDTTASEGYTEPSATAGTLPTAATDSTGNPIEGYVRMAYIVTANGRVAETRVLRATDRRLVDAALGAMAGWRFAPGRLNGVAVPTTAAQEFTFGGVDPSNGFVPTGLIMYQSQDILLRRLPSRDAFGAYLDQLKRVARHFFVGTTAPETIQIVVILRPGRSPRAWFVSSARMGNAPELEPLRRLLEGVPPAEVTGGPIAFAITGVVAGGDGKDPPPAKEARGPVPQEWRDAAKSLQVPLAVSSDGYLNLVWREAK
jgi:TonB family protein